MYHFPLYTILIPLGYLFGSLPSARLIVGIFYGQDIYRLGSGNGGATNVYRQFGLLPALAVLLMDVSKGFFPALFLGERDPFHPASLLLVAGAIAGHAYPLWTGFRGGKGAAVGAGALAALFPGSVPFCLGAFLLGALGSGYASVGSLAAALTLPVYYFLSRRTSGEEYFVLTEALLILLSLAIILLHRTNIQRLIRGEEKTWKRPKRDRAASSPGDGD